MRDKYYINLNDKEYFNALSSLVSKRNKLIQSGIKSVQGDSGHAQVKMVTDVYSHILDEDRRLNVQRFEETFY